MGAEGLRAEPGRPRQGRTPCHSGSRAESPHDQAACQAQGHPPPQRPTPQTHTTRNQWRRPVLVALGSVVAVAAVIVGTRLVLDGSNRRGQAREPSDLIPTTVPMPLTDTPPVRTVPRGSYVSTPKTKTTPKTPSEFTTIFDGSGGKGWILCDGSPLPRANVQDGALNPHGTRSELVVFQTPLDDFVLEFDYKLTEKGNAGVFLRVSNLNAPAETGLKIALGDSPRAGSEDSGALHHLVAPEVKGQNPGGGWNRVRIAAKGPRVVVSLNGIEVTTIDLDRWTTPGKRPDGSVHKFQDVAFGELPRAGYLGFQSLYSNCWFKNVRVSTSSLSSRLAGAVPSYVETGQFTGHNVVPRPFLGDVALAPDGLRVLSGGQDGMARLWELETGREIHAFPCAGMVWSVAFSPDGHHAMTASHDSLVRFWDLDRRRLMAKPPVHRDHVTAVAYFPNGLTALSAGCDDIVMLWDVRQRKPMGPVGKHAADIQCLAISPDGRLALTGGQDRVVKIWDFSAGASYRI